MSTIHLFFQKNPRSTFPGFRDLYPGVQFMIRVTVCLLIIFHMHWISALTQPEKPYKMPMQAVCENSLEASWLEKEVLESRTLDNMENIELWSKSGVGNMSLSNERAKDGNTSLRITFPASRPASAGAYPSTGLRRNIDSEDWTGFNRISVWIYPELKNARFVTLALMISNIGETKVPDIFGRTGRHDIILEPDKWNHIVWEIPFLSRDKVTSISFVHIIEGKERNGIADTGYFDFDMLELQKVNADHYEGWNVAPGEIAFSNSGYQTGGRKTAIMDENSEDEFSLIQLETGKTVLTKPIQKTESYINRFNVMDFSEINEKGTYVLKAGGLYSRPFRIGDDVWKESIWKSINYWYCQRCGQVVEGVHDICHRDVTSKHDSLQIVVNGGWHDAGDLTQMIYNTAPAVYAMFSLADQVENTDKVLYDRLIDEGLWGLDWMLNTRFGDGYRHNFGGISRWSDGIIGSKDDLSFRAQKTPYENFLSASAIARAALTLRKNDRVKADQCIKAAKEDWEAAIGGMTKPEVEICGEAVIVSLNLFELTGDEQYAKKAIEWGDVLIKSQQQSYPDWKIPFVGFFYRDPEKIQILRYNPIAQDQAPIMALEKLCKAFPGHEQWINWYTALTLHAEYLKAASKFSMPYGMIPQSIYHVDEQHTRSLYGLQQSSLAGGNNFGTFKQQVMNGMELGNGYYLRFFPVWFGHRGNFGIQLAQAKALAVASQLRNDLDGINLSRMQLEWIVGKNPFCQSTMYGEGYDFAPLYTPSSGHIVGGLPVGIQTSENKDLPFWPSSACYNYKEIWSNPSVRWLWLMEDVAFPSRIEITGNNLKDISAHFIEKATGKSRDIIVYAREKPASVEIPEGNYTVQLDGKEQDLVLLPGKAYTLQPGKSLSYSISYEMTPKGTIRINLKAEGSGKVQFELRGWNLKIGKKIQNTGMLDEKVANLAWDVSVIDPLKPWVAVVVPDGKISEMKELCNIKMGK